ncbi:MAG: DNA translocase FtsK [bacterium]
MDNTNLNKQVEELTNRVLILEKMVAYLLYTEPREDEDEIDIPYDNPLTPQISDEDFNEAWKVVSEVGKASTSYLQRRMSLGYNRAAMIMERLEKEGIISEAQGVMPRTVLRKYENKEN